MEKKLQKLYLTNYNLMIFPITKDVKRIGKMEKKLQKLYLTNYNLLTA